MRQHLTGFTSVLQGACGALFSVVPFVSKRALGLVCGFVGAGGNTGSAITQVRTIFSPFIFSFESEI